MNKKTLIKILLILILVIMVITNISYAVNITKNDLKESLAELLSSNIEIETTSITEIVPEEGVTIEGDNTVTATSTLKYSAPDEVIVNDSKIILKDYDENDKTNFIAIEMDYVLENNKAKFNLELSPETFGKDETYIEENPLFIIALVLTPAEIMSTNYLAVADSLGIDLNLAASYYNQGMINTNKENNYEKDYNEIYENDIYKYTFSYKESEIKTTSILEVNLDELAKLNNTYLDGTATSIVKVSNNPKDENNDDNNISNNVTEDNNLANNTSNTNNTVNNTVNNTNKTENKLVNNTSNKVANQPQNKAKDNTVANKKIPAAGAETIYYLMLSIVVIALALYVKIRKYDDVK
ncbi:MAG TPA: hypothetical protein IAD08_06800 [Candidatus Scatovivens faecipullorum]|nr:hypothetical protein [Candidatus Scatovivens faecipullorum]